jgi:hypothetical protein
MDKDQMKEWHNSPAPIGRIGQPSELGPAYVFLASQDGSFISGQRYVLLLTPLHRGAIAFKYGHGPYRPQGVWKATDRALSVEAAGERELMRQHPRQWWCHRRRMSDIARAEHDTRSAVYAVSIVLDVYNIILPDLHYIAKGILHGCGSASLRRHPGKSVRRETLSSPPQLTPGYLCPVRRQRDAECSHACGMASYRRQSCAERQARGTRLAVWGGHRGDHGVGRYASG